MGTSALLFSVHPKFAQLIIDGTKTVELRRTRPRITHGDVVFFYATVPVKAVVAYCRVEQVISDCHDSIWQLVEEKAALSRPDFTKYYAGTHTAHAIFLLGVTPLSNPVPLEDLRRGWPEFRPPQSYRYIPEDKTSLLHEGRGTCLQ